MTTDTPPRRKWHLTRWLTVFIAAALGWSGWQAYAFRSALAEAKALGWEVNYTDTVEEIRKNWKASFKKATWLDGVTYVRIPTSEAFEQHLAVVYWLNPKSLTIDVAATLRDLSALKRLTRLEYVHLFGCAELTNVDGLKNLPALREVCLSECRSLPDASIAWRKAAVKAAHPKAIVIFENN